jgi:hypothetical protein
MGMIRGRVVGLVLALAFGLASVVHAAGETIFVLNTTTRDTGDALDVTLFYTVRDGDGQPVLPEQARFGDATMQLLNQSGERGAPVVAEVAPATTPIRVALLIDASGSMSRAMPAVKQAAIESLGQAPDQARFAVFAFNRIGANQAFTPIEAFPENRELVRDAINAIPNPVGGEPTCLFDATYRVIEFLASAAPNPEDRRALVVFTDGKDDVGDGANACLAQTADSVVRKALEERVPLITVGLCTGTCDNLAVDVLERMGSETGGSSVRGVLEEMRDRFGSALASLKSQWIVRAPLLATAGTNQVAITLERQGAPPIGITTTFESPRDFNPAAQAQLALQRRPDGTAYQVLVRVTNPESLGDLVVATFEASEQGQRVLIGERAANLREAARDDEGRIVLDQPISGFSNGRTYCFVLRERGNDTALGEVCDKFVLNPQFGIASVRVDRETNTLVINLQIAGVSPSDVTVSGQVTLAGNLVDGATVRNAQPNADGSLVIDLPAAIADARESRSYDVALTLEVGDARVPAVSKFDVAPVERLNLVPLIAIGVMLVVALIIALLLFRRRTRSSDLDLPPPPPGGRAGPFNDTTTRLNNSRQPAAPRAEPPAKPASSSATPPPQQPQQPASGQPPFGMVTERAQPGSDTVAAVLVPTTPIGAVRVSILRTVDAREHGRAETPPLPCIIGRREGSATLVIGGDPKLSSQHLRIELRDRTLYCTDLKSTNSTFINEQALVPEQPFAITGPTHVRLGPNTVIEVRPLG